MLAVLVVMSDLETSLIRGKLGCDDDDATFEVILFVTVIPWLWNLVNANL